MSAGNAETWIGNTKRKGRINKSIRNSMQQCMLIRCVTE